MNLWQWVWSDSQMVGWWGWLATIKGCVILGVAGGASILLGRASAAARHLVWSLGLASVLAVPVCMAVLPAWRVAWMPQLGAQSRPFGLGTPALESAGITSDLAAQAGHEAEPTSGKQAALTPRLRWPGWLMLSWGAGVGCMLGALGAGWLTVRRIALGAVPANDDLWAEPLVDACDRLGLGPAVRLLTSGQVKVPMAWGWRRPTVLLPMEADAWPEERRRMVLLHELAHVKRWDGPTQVLARVACALYWFNPLVWLAAWRMRVERERACDDRVLSAGSKASEYADQLLQIASGLRREGLAAWGAVAMARRSTLEGRLLAILDKGRNRAAMTRWAVLASLGVLACVVAPVAMLQGGQDREVPTPRTRHFVRVVVGAHELTFQGEPMTWSKLTEAVSDVVDRDRTVLEWATSGEDWTLRQYDETMSRLFKILQSSGFEYLSYVGSHPLSSKGAESQVIRREPKAESAARDTKAAEPARQFVRVLLGPTGVSFEGRPATWEQLDEMLERVSDRAHTVLEYGTTTGEMPLRDFLRAQSRVWDLGKKFGFKYTSYVGVHERL